MFLTQPLTPDFGMAVLAADEPDILKLDHSAMISLFQEAGVLLFRGFGVNTETFKAFTDLFGSNFMAYVGGAYNKRETINNDKTLLTVTGRKLKFGVPLHGEMYYMHRKPTLLWFYCETPAATDGETTVCDGIAIYKALSDSTRELFETKKIKYLRSYPDGKWQEVYQTDDLDFVAAACQENGVTAKIDHEKKLVETEYTCPAIIDSPDGTQRIFINNILPVAGGEYLLGDTSSVVRLEDDSHIPQAVLLELKGIAERLTKPVAWQKGDIIMVDNRRMLHGRRLFSDDRRNIYVRLSQVSF